MKSRILNIIMNGACFAAGLIVAEKVIGKQADQWYRQKERSGENYQRLSQLVKLQVENKSIMGYLKERGYNSLAVYGFGDLGEHLLDELVKEKADIRYVIDKQKKTGKYNIPICSLEQEWEPVDLIIVTPAHMYDEIRRDIRSRVSYPVVSIDEVIYGL